MMGSVLVQPQRVRRARVANPAVSLISDFGALVTRLLVDRKQGGRIGEIVNEAAADAFERLLAERRTRMQQAGPRIVTRLLSFVRAITGVSGSVSLESPASAVDLASGMIDHIAAGLDGISAAELRPHIQNLLDILEVDLGLGLPVLEGELWSLIDEVIDRLETAPAEGNARLKENRFECACMLGRIRRLLQGRLPAVRFNADALAALLAGLLRELKAPRVAAHLRCVADALRTAAMTGQSVEALVELPALSELRTLGAAAAAAANEEKFCWYATWLLGENVVINRERTRITVGSTVHEIPNATLHDIPGIKRGTTDQFYTFKAVDAEALETIAYVSAVCVDATVLLLHTVSLEEGDFLSNTFNLLWGLAGGLFKLTTKKQLVPLWVEDWLVPGVITIAASFEGWHSNSDAGDKQAVHWTTLLVPDFGEERLYRGYAKVARNALLSIITLANHEEPEQASGSAPQQPSPLNHTVTPGLTDLCGHIISIPLAAAVPRDEWGFINTQVDPREPNFGLIFGWVLGFATLAAYSGRFVGGFIAAGISGKAAARAAFLARSWSILEHWFWHTSVLYMWKEGSTDDGHYDPAGAGEYGGYKSHESSPYLLPFQAGVSCYVGQGNGGLFSHNKLNGNQTYAFDFSLDQAREILAVRNGTVVDWFDWCPDDENVETNWPDATVEPTIRPVAGQTTNTKRNFILIRHDRDEDGNLLAVGEFDEVHDRVLNNDPMRTYSSYLHGRTGSVREAFASRGIDPNDIIGARIWQGNWIMRCGATGKAPQNHLHFAIRGGPDVDNTPPASTSTDEVPMVFRDVTNFLGTDGLPGKLNFYTSTNELDDRT